MISKLFSLFKQDKVISHIDNFEQYEYIADVSLVENIETLLNEELYNNVDNYLSSFDYKWSLEIGDIYIISQEKYDNLDLDYIEEISNVRLSIKIFKLGRETIIFNQEVFFNMIREISLEDILSIFQRKAAPILIENPSSYVSLKTNLIGYNSDVDILENKEISIQCLFYNYSEFKFSPENFSFNNSENQDDFSIIIQKLYLVFILFFLFDISEIKDNEIFIKLKGYKTYEYKLDFSSLNLNSVNEYKKIYEWVYSDKGKIEDKLGIARNILSFYLKQDNIELDNRVFPSILSANQMYIKGNLSKYLDSRSKIYEQVDQITSKINSSLDLFLNNFQKSIFTFVSFYIGAFAIRVFNNKVDISNVVNKEVTLFGIGLLGISFVFMIFSLVSLNLDLRRVKDKYKIIKQRFEDILNKDDIDKILNKDKEFNKDFKFYKKRRCQILSLWILTLVILLCVLFSTSEYINFKYLYE